MDKAAVIQTINRIQEDDRAEQVKRGERKPTNQKFVTVIAVIVTLVILIVPAFVLAFLFPDANALVVNLFIYGFIALIIGSLVFWRRCRIMRFLKVKNAHTLFDHIDAKDQLKTIIEKDALVFAGDLNDQAYDLIYNWLNYRQMLRGERLNIYTFTGDQLRHATTKRIDVLDYFQYHAIRLDDLNMDSAQYELFCNEHFIAGGRWLSDLLA